MLEILTPKYILTGLQRECLTDVFTVGICLIPICLCWGATGA